MKKIIVDDYFLSNEDKKYIIDKIARVEDLNIELLFKSDFSYTSKIRDFAGFLCDSLGIDSVLRFKIILIVDELDNNAIEYGSLSGDINKLRIFVKFNEEGFNIGIEVEDTGRGKKHKSSVEMLEIGKNKISEGFYNRSIRGRGLFLIINNIVNKLYFKDSDIGGLIVGVEKNINYKKIDKK